MKVIWEKIKQELSKISLEISQSLEKPATQSEIYNLEKELKVSLPNSFKEYLQVFNGQNHNNYTITFVGYNCLLPIGEIIKTYNILDIFFDDSSELKTSNKIQSKIWDKNWIPFADYEANTKLILDLNPGKSGNGQILQIWSGQDLENDNVVVADSFEQFSKRILNDIKNNKFEFDKETKAIELHNEWII